jgi:integrase
MRALVTAALLTGCRYGELVAMRAADFDRDNGTLHIPESKSGKPRHVVLASEGRQFFEDATTGKAASAVVFLRSDGREWKPTDQIRPLKAACHAARISPAVSFHILRHTYASRLARAGVPMAVIAAQLGHADLRMTTRHYAHLSPGYIADTVRAAFGSMGLVGALKKVVTIENGRKRMHT